MEQNVEMIITGIKCDAPDCEYTDPTVGMDDYAAILNAPCPLCGAILLTQADFEAVQDLISIGNIINDMDLSAFPQTPEYKISLSMDGSGDVGIKSIKEMPPCSQPG